MNEKNWHNSEVTEEYLQKEEGSILKMAVAQMNIHVFVYDVIFKKLHFFNHSMLPFGILKETECAATNIIAKGIIDKDYTSAFLSLFDDVARGEEKVEGLIKLQMGSSTWNHIILLTCFNSEGAPIRAVGTIQDVSTRVETELRYAKEKQYRLAMMADSRRVYEVNVTRDRFTKLKSIQDSTDYGTWDLYTESMRELCYGRVYEEDWENFFSVARREKLLQGYAKGTTEFYCEYRFIESDGSMRWSSSATHLLKDPISSDIKGFIYVKDIDQQKRTELELSQRAERDPLTGAYNRRSAEQFVARTLECSDKTQLHGFLNIDFDDFKSVNDNYGHINGDILLKQIVQSINDVLGGDDIFARMGGDEFLVFLCNMPHINAIEDIANRICESVRNVRIEGIRGFIPTVSIGISTYPKNGCDFTELYKSSDASLYEAKARGKNIFLFFDK